MAIAYYRSNQDPPIIPPEVPSDSNASIEPGCNEGKTYGELYPADDDELCSAILITICWRRKHVHDSNLKRKALALLVQKKRGVGYCKPCAGK